ncbi:MAG TPA: outer membrane lipoprotein-sorting protein [Pyrinomonadaceae bacterium]|nr:outer membrane lipoprotein-sorting protein [Pyrinomonadaceae bacterium]
MRYFISLLVLTFIIAPATLAAKITTTEDLVQALQKKYAKSWYKTATFVQKTTNIDKDGNQKVGIWYEAMSVPGSLRIDFTPVKEGNGILFTNGQIYSFKNGKVENNRPFVHPLMILGFDMYRLPQADVLEKLKGLKFDLSIFREDTWQGRPVYVVGAKAGDLHSPQFWIDQKNLYFVRLLRPAGRDGAQTQETQFNKYQKLGGGWMSPEVIFMVDGKTVTTEEYSEMKADTPLDNKLFDPQYFATVHWRE